MKKLAYFKRIFSLTILLILASLSFSARTGNVPCSDYVDMKFNVGVHDGCALGHDSQDFLNDPLQVNEDMMFGYTDWSFDFKFDDLDDDAAMMGTFNYDLDWDDFEHVMVVFKSGASDNTEPNIYVGYLLNMSEDEYSWSSMFVNSMNDNPKGVSHISFYTRGDGVVPPACLPGPPPFCDTPIPEPQSLLILSAGILGIIIRRKMLTLSNIN